MAIREIARAFLTKERPEEVYQLALDRVSPIVGATFACAYLVDPGSPLMRLVAVHNWPSRYAPFLDQMRVRLGAGPSGEAASARRMIEVTDVFADEHLADWQEVATELGFRSLVALPLQTSEEVHGVVTFYFASSNRQPAETRHLLRTVADQMAATAEKARLIDDLRAANAALRASNAQLEQQNADLVEARRIKDEFLANISHELRTPLTAVIGYISLMLEGLAGPVTTEQHESLLQVKDASEQLLSLIGDLLDLTALKRGSLGVLIAEVDPRDPLRDAVAAARGRRAQVSLEIALPDLVPTVRTDRRAVTKALQALIDNAYKFTREGRVRLSLRVSGDRIVYSIEDTGVGIPADAHRAVFEEFRQLQGGLTREFGGSGLGLSLARQLARLVHGEITMTSNLGEGSTFTLELPLQH
jgi:signal transduction histidine kinase